MFLENTVYMLTSVYGILEICTDKYYCKENMFWMNTDLYIIKYLKLSLSLSSTGVAHLCVCTLHIAGVTVYSEGYMCYEYQ